MTAQPAARPPRPTSNHLTQELERVHDRLRSDLRACQELAVAVRAGAPAADLRAALAHVASRSPHLRLGVDCLRFCELVHRHHGGKDTQLFPVVRRTAPHLAQVVDRLEADHRQVSRLLFRVEAAVDQLDEPDAGDAVELVAGALQALADHLLTHLAVEEEALRPFLLSMDEWPADERDVR